MPLVQYLWKGKMELVWQEIKLSTRIQLKTLPHWQISETWLEECLEFKTKRRLAIIIIVKNSLKAFILYFKQLRLREVLKVIKKY